MDFTFHICSPLGGITLAGDGNALTGLWFDGQKYFSPRLSRECTEKDLPVFRETALWLEIYFGGGIPDFTPALHPAGTPFRLAVWNLLLEIPYGRTVTYGQLAAKSAVRLGRPRMSPQAVGGAVGHNPISLIIPCHRVLGADGSLTGYAGGLDRKKRLLELEKAL